MKMYKRLDDAEYTSLRRSLIKKGSVEKQKDFLKATRSSKTFTEMVRQWVGSHGTVQVEIIEKKLTEHQYKDPTKDTEQQMYLAWKDVPPETSCRTDFWGEVTLRHIEEDRIQASYLAANGGSTSGGLQRLDTVLSGGTEKEIDACVRTILRNLGGLPEARGNRSVYVNCPFGRAWWREKFAEEICENTGASRDSILAVLRVSQQYWEEIVTIIVSRNSVLGDSKVRDALAWVLSEKSPENDLFKPETLKRLCRLLGVRCAWQELGVLEIDELKVLIDQEIASL